MDSSRNATSVKLRITMIVFNSGEGNNFWLELKHQGSKDLNFTVHEITVTFITAEINQLVHVIVHLT